MKTLYIVLLAWMCPCIGIGLAQPDPFSLDDMLQAGEQWMQENLDTEVLTALQTAAPETVDVVSQVLQERFQDDYAAGVALFQQVAAVLPLIEEPAEAPVDVARMTLCPDGIPALEAFDAAPLPSIPELSQPLEPWPTPRVDSEREVVPRRTDKRPVPRGTEDLIARLKPIFIAHQVPAELIWVAEVESSFKPRARSSTGAAGLFQLKPATAVSLGLSLWPTDQRLDPEANARGAAKYLKALRNRFKDWPLALAAYRVGETRVQALLTEHNTRTYEGIATHLPVEAQTYVPKLNATLLLREGVSLATLPLSN